MSIVNSQHFPRRPDDPADGGETHPILEGARGNPPADKKALEKLLLLCSEVIEAYPEIQEMDLNPVIVHEKGLSVVDARIILKERLL